MRTWEKRNRAPVDSSLQAFLSGILATEMKMLTDDELSGETGAKAEKEILNMWNDSWHSDSGDLGTVKD